MKHAVNERSFVMGEIIPDGVKNEVKMTYLFGIDTGGTYTDGVILRGESAVIASTKSLTTREDLVLGIGYVVQSVLSASAISAAQISMAYLSTTLVTNALFEGQGDMIV